jgi:hypothetical protein
MGSETLAFAFGEFAIQPKARGLTINTFKIQIDNLCAMFPKQYFKVLVQTTMRCYLADIRTYA